MWFITKIRGDKPTFFNNKNKFKTQTEMAKKKMIVGCSPLTGAIFAGTLLDDGKRWGVNKQDVTDTAVGAVAQHLVHKQEALVFEMSGKKYRMEVNEID